MLDSWLVWAGPPCGSLVRHVRSGRRLDYRGRAGLNRMGARLDAKRERPARAMGPARVASEGAAARPPLAYWFTVAVEVEMTWSEVSWMIHWKRKAPSIAGVWLNRSPPAPLLLSRVGENRRPKAAAEAWSATG